jgi:hypothetical protein
MQAGKLANAKVGTEQAQANKINQELASNAELKAALNAIPKEPEVTIALPLTNALFELQLLSYQIEPAESWAIYDLPPV